MQFHFHANQSHFHKRGFALRLALKQTVQGNSEMAYYGVISSWGAVSFRHIAKYLLLL